MGYERQLMGDDGLNAAEILYETIDEETGERALPAPTAAALKAATIDKVDAKMVDIDEHLAGSSLELGEAVAQKFGEVDDKLDDVDTALSQSALATGAANEAAGAADSSRTALEAKAAELLAAAPAAAADRLIAEQQAQSILSARVSFGEQATKADYSGTALNGGAMTVVGGRSVGFAVPAGSTGTSTYVRPEIAFTADEAAALAGATVRLKVVAVVTPNFVGEKPIVPNPLQAITSAAQTVTVGALARSEQAGTLLFREATVVFDANWRKLGMPLQLAGVGNVTTNAHSLQVVSFTLVVESLAGKAVGGADFALQRLINERAAPIEAGLAANNTGLAAARAAAAAARLTSGDIALDWVVGNVFNGATVLAAPAKGFAIPSGSTGQNSFSTARVPFTAAMRAGLVGRTLRFMAVAEATAGFVAQKPLNASGVLVDIAGGGQRQNQGVIVRAEQIGTKIYREITYTVVGDEAYVGVVFQVGGGAATSNLTLQIANLSYAIEATPASSAATPNDEQFRWRFEDLFAGKGVDAALASMLSNVSGAAMLAGRMQLTFGDQPLTSSVGQMFNGAVAIAGPGGGSNIIGFTSPAGASINPTYVTPRIALSAAQRATLTGRTVRLKTVATVTAGFLTDRTFGTNPVNVTTTGGVTRQNQGTLVRSEQIGTTLYREATYTIVGDEEWLMTPLQIASSSGTANDHSLTVTGITFALEAPAGGKATTPNDEQLALVLDALGIAGLATTVAGKRFGFANRLADLTPLPQFFNGTVARVGADGRNWGWTVPVGQTGSTTLLQFRLDLQGLGALLAGRKVRVSIGADTSAAYSQINNGVVQVVRPGGSPNLSTALVRNTQVSANRRILEIEATLDGTETALQPFFGRGTQTTPAAAEQYLVVTDITFEIVASPSDQLSLLEENNRLGAALRAASQSATLTASYTAAIQNALIGGGGYAVTKTVKPDGTGDFTHPRFAVESITDASASKRYRVLIYPSIYTGQANWNCKDHVDLVGIDRATCIVHYENPDDTPVGATAGAGVIANTQTFWCNTETTIENLTVTLRNGRYPIHSDSSGNLKGRKQRLRNCHVEHLGNDGARAWQAANGGNPNLVWGSEHAWGYGSSSAMVVEMDRLTTLKSKISALYIHTRENFAEPSVMDVRNCQAIATNSTGVAVTVQPLGSRRNDLVLLNNNALVGDIRYNAQPWIQTTLDYQPASHAEVVVTGAGNSPAVFTVTDWGRALKIESASTSNNSTVAVSGSAVPIIMGEVVSKPGAGGLKGYVHGAFDVSGTGVGLASDVFITSLGKRLGNCTAAPKTLTIAIDGGAPVSVTFDQNYTDATNGSILALIQAAIGASGNAVLYAVGERYRPSFLDEEQALRNATAVGIPMGSVLAYDVNHKTIRLMTSADPASRFAGVAWEDIYPDTSGRVKTKGYLHIGDVLRTDAAAIAFGDTFSIDAAAPGRVIKGGAQGLLSAIRNDAVKVR